MTHSGFIGVRCGVLAIKYKNILNSNENSSTKILYNKKQWRVQNTLVICYTIKIQDKLKPMKKIHDINNERVIVKNYALNK